MLVSVGMILFEMTNVTFFLFVCCTVLASICSSHGCAVIISLDSRIMAIDNVGLEVIRRVELESQMIESQDEGALRKACALIKIASELLVVSGNMCGSQDSPVNTLRIQFKEPGFEVKMLGAENPFETDKAPSKKRRCEERQA